jgi:hypothetical protein
LVDDEHQVLGQHLFDAPRPLLLLLRVAPLARQLLVELVLTPAYLGLDDLAERALRETNRDKRKQLYWELQRYILTKGDHPSVPVGWVEGWFFKDKKLRNYKPGLTTYDNNTFMKVWLAQ